jgi:hypothetical protein
MLRVTLNQTPRIFERQRRARADALPFEIYGALLWMGDKLRSDQHEHARALWNAKGKQAFETDPETRTRAHRIVPATHR